MRNFCHPLLTGKSRNRRYGGALPISCAHLRRRQIRTESGALSNSRNLPKLQLQQLLQDTACRAAAASAVQASLRVQRLGTHRHLAKVHLDVIPLYDRFKRARTNWFDVNVCASESPLR